MVLPKAMAKVTKLSRVCQKKQLKCRKHTGYTPSSCILIQNDFEVPKVLRSYDHLCRIIVKSQDGGLSFSSPLDNEMLPRVEVVPVERAVFMSDG